MAPAKPRGTATIIDYMNSLVKLPVTSTLTGATIQTAERNEFSNTGRDTIKITVQNIIDRQTVTPESEQNSRRNIAEDNKDLQPVSYLGSDPGFYAIISTALAAIFGQRKIQSPGGIGERACSDHTNPADRDASTDLAPGHDFEPAAIISDIPAHINFSLLSPSITTERYTRSMLDCQCTAGYPLYEPRPDSERWTEYWKKGVRIGDVGIVTEDGVFDFLFNVCPSQNPSINPSGLPDDFEALECPEIRVIEQHLEMQTHLFSKTVNRVEEPDVKYKCLGPEGAILELPAGATLFDAKNKDTFKRLASRHAENWYRYLIVTRGRDAPNGSLYLVTSCIKCTHWGIALFDRPSTSQDYLQFIENEVDINTNQNLRSKYRWKGLGASISKATRNSDIPNTSDGDSQNQCVFLRGYKIMLRKDVWDNAIDPDFSGTPYMTTFDTSAPNQTSNQTRHGDSSGNQNNHTGHEGEGSLQSEGPMDEDTPFIPSSQIESERVIVQADFNSSPLHPSDFINTVLLSQEPIAKAALTHDDDWWNLMQDYNDVAKITSSCTSVIDEYGSVSLEFAGQINNIAGISTHFVAPIPLHQLGHAQPHKAVNSEIMLTSEDGEELGGPPEREGTTYSSSTEPDGVAHISGPGDVNAGKAWGAVGWWSDMNEYSKVIKVYSVQEKSGKAHGKVFVKKRDIVLGIKNMYLPLPQQRTLLTCTLNNGIHYIATPECQLGQNVTRIDHEFELIEHDKLEFTLTLKVKHDLHIAAQFKALSPPPLPTPVPYVQALTKGGMDSSFSSSPKKSSKEKVTVQTSNRPAHQLPENLARYMKLDGTLARAFVNFKEISARCDTRLFETNYPLIGQRLETGGNFSTQHAGELVLQIFRLPPLPGIAPDQIPQSLDECCRGLRHLNWHKVTHFEGALTQYDGGCMTWERRLFRVIGANLVAFNDMAEKATATIDLKKAVAVEDDQQGRGTTMSPASGRSLRYDDDYLCGVERSFRLTFLDDEDIVFFADSDDEKAKWLEVFRALVGHIPPHPLWGELLWQRQEELMNRTQVSLTLQP